MNTLSAREYTALAPVERLRNWPQQEPSNQGVIDSFATRKIGECITWGSASDFIYVT
jgi:hypothetical protein